MKHQRIKHAGIYSIIALRPQPRFIVDTFASAACHKVNTEVEEYIAPYHTSHELMRMKSSIFPQVRDMLVGDELVTNIEFSTASGLELVTANILSINRSCITVTFEKIAHASS